MTALPATSDDGAFWHHWLSPYFLPCITVADEIGTFAAISGEALALGDLAGKLGVNARALGIHLGLLAGLGMVETRGGKWRATHLARTWMHPEGEGYYGPLLHGFRTSLPMHQAMLDTLKTGHKPEGLVTNVEEWERGELEVEAAHRIAAFMHSHSVASSKAVSRMPDMAGVTSLLDVGGGSGVFAIEIARANPGLAATILEIEAMCTAAQIYIDRAGMASRVRAQPGDMFRLPLPEGHDAHFYSNVFHDWSEQTNRMLAAKSFAALPPGGRIMLHEILMNDDGSGELVPAAFSVLMLLGTRGKQYSLAEFSDILTGAGFVDVQAARTGGGYYSLVTARKP